MIPLTHYLILSGILFAIGLVGVIVRRDIIVIFMCLEMMLSAANLSLVAFSRAQGSMGLPNYDGQSLSIFVLTIAAAEVAIGLALIVSLYRAPGLVAGGQHPNPVPHADFVASTTHKSLRGPRGGFIICKEEYAKKIDAAVFPGMQGGPLMHVIAAKAACFGEALKPEFKDYAVQVVKNARAMSKKMTELGFRVVSNGTDNHVFMVDLRNKGINGADAQEALDRVGITVNKNAIPFDTGSPMKPSGIRIGTPAVTTRGMKEKDVEQVAEFIARALALHVGEQVCPNPEGFNQLKKEVSAFNRNFRLPH